jgi:geranylgeranyl diphosphate synthase type II
MSLNQAINSDFNTRLSEKAQFVNDTLSQLIAKQTDISGDLKEAIRYTLEAGGKRVRSALVLWCCELIKGEINHNAEIAAAAIEMVHTYSLVHDDLPVMDDDDFRRGQPTCHKAFDEATALLTGDALLTLAFEILAKEIDDAAIAVRLIGELAQAAGPAGMIAGQMADLKAENGPRRFASQKRSSGDGEEILEYIHTNKTAKMFRCAAAMGAICGMALDSDLDRLCEYGLKIGLGFQIADDILDVCASSEHLGKTAGKDAKAGKITYPAVVGMEKSKQLGKKLTDEAIAMLEPFGRRADTLRNLAIALLKRTR